MNVVLMSVIVSLITSVIGGLMTGALFYFLGGKQLKREAQELNRLSILILHSLKESGLVDLNYDRAGKVIGIKFKAAPFRAGMHQMSGDLMAEKKSASNRQGETSMLHRQPSAGATLGNELTSIKHGDHGPMERIGAVDPE